MTAPTADDPFMGVRQVVIGPTMWPHLEAWIQAHGFALAPMADGNADDLATYIVVIR